MLLASPKFSVSSPVLLTNDELVSSFTVHLLGVAMLNGAQNVFQPPVCSVRFRVTSALIPLNDARVELLSSLSARVSVMLPHVLK